MLLNKTYKNITEFTKTWVSGKSLLVIKQENVANTIEIISKSQLSKTKQQSNNATYKLFHMGISLDRESENATLTNMDLWAN